MNGIGLEEHYKLPAIREPNQNNPGELVCDLTKKTGHFSDTDPQGGWPAGICALGEVRIAAMNAAGIDVQILSHTAQGPDRGAVVRGQPGQAGERRRGSCRL